MEKNEVFSRLMAVMIWQVRYYTN